MFLFWPDWIKIDNNIDKFLEDKNVEIELIRKSVFGGKPLGSDKFLKKIEKNLNVNFRTRPRGRPYNKK